MKKNKGVFITFEGTEGVGKSTCIEALIASLKSEGKTVVKTREPGGTEIADSIRNVLLSHYDETMESVTEALLMFASRAQLVNQYIKPKLAEGFWVVSDRFTDSSYAYQGAGRGLGKDNISMLETFVHPDLVPDLTILLDAPVDIALERLQSRKEKDRIEREGIDFFNRVRDSFLALANDNPDRYHIIDATQPLETVTANVIDAVKALEIRIQGV